MTNTNGGPVDADLDFDGRWARWLANNQHQDRVTGRRMSAVAVLLGIGLTASLVGALLFR